MSAEAGRSDALRDTGPTHSIRDLPLHRRLVQMKARGWTPPRIATDPRGGKHKLPGPVRGGVGILAIQCKGQDDPPETVSEIAFMLSSHLSQVPPQSLLDPSVKARPVVPRHRGSEVRQYCLPPCLCASVARDSEGRGFSFRAARW